MFVIFSLSAWDSTKTLLLQVEKEFSAAYPTCKLYGIEAMPDQAADFDKYGTVINKGAGTASSWFIVINIHKFV